MAAHRGSLRPEAELHAVRAEESRAADPRTVALAGPLDLAAAHRAKEAVLRARAGEPVAIDCRRVTDIDEAALVFLMMSCERAERPVVVLGLPERQRALPRILDLSLVRAERAASSG